MAYPANRHWKRKNINRSFGWLLVGWNERGAGPAKPSEQHFLVEMTVDLIPTAAALATLQCSLAMRRASSRLGRRWVGVVVCCSLSDGSRMSNLLTKLD